MKCAESISITNRFNGIPNCVGKKSWSSRCYFFTNYCLQTEPKIRNNSLNHTTVHSSLRRLSVAIYQPNPKQVPSETVKVANETRDDMGWTDTTQDKIAGNGLDKYEARESFGINHRGGAPTV